MSYWGLHMVLGVLLVLSLWVIGFGQAFSKGGSWALAAGALVVGLLVIGVGLNQTSLLVGSFHWAIQVIHLLLGLLAAGMGQIVATRYRKGAAAIAAG